MRFTPLLLTIPLLLAMPGCVVRMSDVPSNIACSVLPDDAPATPGLLSVVDRIELDRGRVVVVAGAVSRSGNLVALVAGTNPHQSGHAEESKYELFIWDRRAHALRTLEIPLRDGFIYSVLVISPDEHTIGVSTHMDVWMIDAHSGAFLWSQQLPPKDHGDTADAKGRVWPEHTRHGRPTLPRFDGPDEHFSVRFQSGNTLTWNTHTGTPLSNEPGRPAGGPVHGSDRFVLDGSTRLLDVDTSESVRLVPFTRHAAGAEWAAVDPGERIVAIKFRANPSHAGYRDETELQVRAWRTEGQLLAGIALGPWQWDRSAHPTPLDERFLILADYYRLRLFDLQAHAEIARSDEGACGAPVIALPDGRHVVRIIGDAVEVVRVDVDAALRRSASESVASRH